MANPATLREDLVDDVAEAAGLTAEQAETQLYDVDLVTAMAGSIPEMKALRDRALAAGIPAVIGCPGGGKSCGPKTHLLIAEASIPALATLLRSEWDDHLVREGLAPVATAMAEDAEHPPCPACGTAAALVNGACADCGIQLE